MEARAMEEVAGHYVWASDSFAAWRLRDVMAGYVDYAMKAVAMRTHLQPALVPCFSEGTATLAVDVRGDVDATVALVLPLHGRMQRFLRMRHLRFHLWSTDGAVAEFLNVLASHTATEYFSARRRLDISPPRLLLARVRVDDLPCLSFQLPCGLHIALAVLAKA